MEAASQQMLNTQLTVAINNPSVKIGDTLEGTITVTCTQPCTIDSFQINLYRELQRAREIGSKDLEQWVFNKENLPAQLQLQAGETKTVSFHFTVSDGLSNSPVTPEATLTLTGLDPAVQPDSSKSYKHCLSVMAKLGDAPIGPIGVVDVNFVYPNLNVNLS